MAKASYVCLGLLLWWGHDSCGYYSFALSFPSLLPNKNHCRPPSDRRQKHHHQANAGIGDNNDPDTLKWQRNGNNSDDQRPSQRRLLLAGGAALLMSNNHLVTFSASAAETVGKDENCNQSNCLGVWDGLLADCPHSKRLVSGGPGCTSSQDDTPGIFAEPWDYSESTYNVDDWQTQMRALKTAIELVSAGRGDSVATLAEQGRYLRVRFVDGKTAAPSVGEFYFTPNDTTVQFRVAAIEDAPGALAFSNRERCEMIRKKLKYQKLPVLRNRQRSLFFIESELDTFGPGSAALGPPAEMRTGELEGRQDVDPRLKIDLLQQFPR
mmetsp:Transcript_12393/g.34365  ORF Transcript_12393/g.34365 Transcript_12393/m.34365 type:complete len:324 (+) Transcript_12393:107-1078(+)